MNGILIVFGILLAALVLAALVLCFRYIGWGLFLVGIGCLADFGLGAITPPRIVEPAVYWDNELVDPAIIDNSRMPIQDIGRALWLWGTMGVVVAVGRRLKSAATRTTEGKEIDHSCAWWLARGLCAAMLFVLLVRVTLVNSANMENALRSRFNTAIRSVEQSRSATTLSREDARILLLWGYVIVKFNHYGDVAAVEPPTAWQENAIATCDIAERLPTSDKYKDLSDATLALTRALRPSFEQGEWPPHPQEATTLAEAVARHAEEMKFAQDRISQAEKDRILEEYFQNY
jgi:hypothetical protein